MSSSCVKNVDSVSEPKSKINEANSNNELLIGDIFGAFSTLKLFSGWGFSSVVERLPSKRKALGLILSS